MSTTGDDTKPRFSLRNSTTGNVTGYIVLYTLAGGQVKLIRLEGGMTTFARHRKAATIFASKNNARDAIAHMRNKLHVKGDFIVLGVGRTKRI